MLRLKKDLTVLQAQTCALQRIELQAREGGSMKEILRECQAVEEFTLAVGSCESDEEIQELIDRHNV